MVGAASFAPIAAAFILYGLANERFAKKWLLWAATFALVISVPVMGSRTYVYLLGAVVACAGVAALCGVTEFLKSLRVIVPFIMVFALASLLPIFTESSKNLNKRFSEANQVEGGGQRNVRQALVNRSVTPMMTRFEESDFMSNPIGIGMGHGALAISKLLTGKPDFTAGEGEFDHVMTEFGPFSGLAFMLFRILLALMLLKEAVARAREGEPLALLLAPLMVSAVAFGTSENPTAGGFMVIYTAFSLAALKRPVVLFQSAPGLSRVLRPARYSSPAR